MYGRLLFAVGLCVAASGAALAAQFDLPQGPNRDLVYGRCRTCHDLQYVVDSAGITRDDWDATLQNMRQFGLRLEPDKRKKILDYLATYLGPNPPPAPKAGTTQAAAADGEQVFAGQCTACHGEQGRGANDQFPPLAGNRDLFISRLFPAYVLLNGLSGPIQVEGRQFDAQMPAFDHLSDAKLAAVINYVRQAWGNADLKVKHPEPLDAQAVKQARGKAMTPAEVHDYRAAQQ